MSDVTRDCQARDKTTKGNWSLGSLSFESSTSFRKGIKRDCKLVNRVEHLTLSLVTPCCIIKRDSFILSKLIKASKLPNDFNHREIILQNQILISSQLLFESTNQSN